MIISDYFPLVSTIFVAAMGLLVLRRNSLSRINTSFFLFCLAIAVWMFGTFMMFANRSDISAAVFWDRFVYAGVVFIPAIMLDFALGLIRNKKWNSRHWLMMIGYVISLIFLPLVFSEKFVSGAFIYKWGLHTKAQVLHTVFLAYFITYLTFFFILVGDYYRKTAVALEKLQIKYIFIAFFILAVAGSLGYLPAYGISIYPVSYLSGVVFVIIMSYAIMKYRFMDIREVARTFLVYFLDSLYAYGFYSLLIIVYGRIWGTVYTPYSLVAGIAVGPTFVVSLFAVHRAVVRFLNRYVFHSLYDHQKAMTALAQDLNRYTELGKIIDLIVGRIKSVMALDRAGVLILDSEQNPPKFEIAKVVGFNEKNGISLVTDNVLTRYLEKTQKPLVRDEMVLISKNAKTAKEAKRFLEFKDYMEHIQAALCLPLISNNKLIGMIVLGEKVSRDAYTGRDLDLLFALSLQASIAIDNARLYKKVNEFNDTLQQKVDDQTKELQAKALHLQKLLKMRTEFLDIASHQFKTPISVIRGTISMFQEGSMDKLPASERQKFYNNIASKAQKLNAIISDILRASEMDTDEFTIDYKTARPESLEDMAKTVVSQLEEVARDKQVKVVIDKPESPLPQLLTSGEFLEQAIYNLVDNAIKYSPAGEVRIILSQDGDALVLKVKDSGIGIPKKDQAKLFEKFTRGGNAVNMYADGSGLGLFIVKKIVEAHKGGQVSMESAEGKGTTFTIRLPIVKVRLAKPAATFQRNSTKIAVGTEKASRKAYSNK